MLVISDAMIGNMAPRKGEIYFCLSPNLQEDLIDEIDEIISLAPNLIGWEFILSSLPLDKFLSTK